MNTDPKATPRGISRRSVAKGSLWSAPAGSLWSAPALAVASAAPALATSAKLTGTADTPQAYYAAAYGAPSDCSSTKNDGGGFLDTQACTPTNGAFLQPASGSSAKPTPAGDCLQDPNSSIGVWLETQNANSATARITSATLVFKFTYAIRILTCPNGTANQIPSNWIRGYWHWTECTTLNGWTYTLSTDGKTLTLTYNTPTTVQTSTGVDPSGTALPGFFINFQYTSGCPTGGTVTATTKTVAWADATYPNGTSTTVTGTTQTIS